jgi:hypothetical protein
MAKKDTEQPATEPANRPDAGATIESAAGPTKRRVKPGDRVHLLTVHDGHVPADVMSVGQGNTVTLWCRLPNGEDLTIGDAPFDPTGTKPDSWHWPESAEA